MAVVRKTIAGGCRCENAGFPRPIPRAAFVGAHGRQFPPASLSPSPSTINMVLNTTDEIQILKDAIKEYGSPNAEGKHSVAYGILFDRTANTLEALNGTLRAAKKQKKVQFDAELLMMPKDKDVQVVLLED
ncbi:hypothetical protein PM082_006561 [Marasmius tenuissimus]|nr:hypothetical protein PM082_006561 [Marasmius tenuissimus]